MEDRRDYFDDSDESWAGLLDSTADGAVDEQTAFHMAGVPEYLEYLQSSNAAR